LTLAFGKGKYTFNRVPIIVPSTVVLSKFLGYELDEVFVELSDGTFGEVVANQSHVFSLRKCHKQSFDSNELRRVQVLTHYHSGYYGSTPNSFNEEYIKYDFNPNDSFFNVELDVVTSSGNVIKRNLV
jgi:hypothetical protein